MKKQVLVIVYVLAASLASSQEVLTLQVCLEKVEKNELQTISERSSWSTSRVNSRYHWWTLLPDMSANTSVNTSFGRRLDPFTNTFATSSVNSQSFGLNASVQLFDGFSYYYKRRLLKTSILRDEIDWTKKQNEGKIRAVETYLALCKLDVQTQLTTVRIEKYKQLQDVQRFLIHEGRIHAIDTLKSQHALLREQEFLVNFSNEMKLKMIELNFQMNLPLKTTYKVAISSVSGIGKIVRFTEFYEVESIETQLEILENTWRSERSAFLPSLSLNGLVGTGFSTNNKDYSLTGTPTKGYSRQMNENLYEGIGFYLNIPLFNRGEWLKTKHLNAIQQDELSGKMELTNQLLEKRRLEQEQKRLNLKAMQEQNRQMIDNLQLIYQKSLLLYEAGRLTYAEIELTLMEWQVKLEEYELLEFDLKLLELFGE